MQDFDTVFTSEPEARTFLFSRMWRALYEDADGIVMRHPVKPERARIIQSGDGFRIQRYPDPG